MTLIILLALIGVFIFIRIPSEKIFRLKWIQSLNKYKWFQNPWLIGVSLFGMNLLLFCTTGLILYVMTVMMIPFLHLVIMAAAIMMSLLVWSSLVHSREWGEGERLKTAMAGSSFYLFLFLFILYKWGTYESRYPGEDGGMAAVGFFLGLLVTGLAFVIGFVMVAFLPADGREK
ncbi:hypothetical protein HF072_10845 [Bacillus sp. RO3]|nr:hypothetical protein [Bacillus sp. RO3]